MYAQANHMPHMKRCLVIEDSLFDQKLIQRTAQSARVDAILEFVSSLAAARRALEANHFSVILCDNNLPDGSGSDFAKELADDPEHLGTSIVIVSGWPSPFMWAKARAAGLQIIDKNDQLQAKLRKVFQRHLGRSQGTASNVAMGPDPNLLH